MHIILSICQFDLTDQENILSSILDEIDNNIISTGINNIKNDINNYKQDYPRIEQTLKLFSNKH